MRGVHVRSRTAVVAGLVVAGLLAGLGVATLVPAHAGVTGHTQTGLVDSTHYDTASALATLEDLLGMPPMSVYDARAVRMWASFQRMPNLESYNAIQPSIVPFGDVEAPVNSLSSPLAAVSARMDFSKPDAAPEATLSEATWKSVRGAGSRMPASRHTLLVPSAATGTGDADG